MSDSLADFRATLIDGLSPLLPCAVLPIGGAFGESELRRVVVHTPCVLVAVLDVEGFERTSRGWKAGAACAAFVVTRNTPETDRDVQAMTIVTDLLRILAADTAFGEIGGARVINPANVAAHNLYSGSLDSSLVALWGVEWTARLVSTES